MAGEHQPSLMSEGDSTRTAGSAANTTPASHRAKKNRPRDPVTVRQLDEGVSWEGLVGDLRRGELLLEERLRDSQPQGKERSVGREDHAERRMMAVGGSWQSKCSNALDPATASSSSSSSASLSESSSPKRHVHTRPGNVAGRELVRLLWQRDLRHDGRVDMGPHSAKARGRRDHSLQLSAARSSFS